MPAPQAALAAAVAFVLVAAVAGKLATWHTWFGLAVVAGRSVRRTWLMAIGVPAAEAAVAVAILVWPALGLMLAALLFAALAAGVLILDGRLNGMPCGCFGALTEGRISRALAARDAASAGACIALAGWCAAGGVGGPLSAGDLAAGGAACLLLLLALRTTRPASRPAVAAETGPPVSRRTLLAAGGRAAVAVALAGMLDAGATLGAGAKTPPANPNIFQGDCVGFAERLVTGAYYDRYNRGHPSHHRKVMGYTHGWSDGSADVVATRQVVKERVVKDARAICDCPSRPVRYYDGPAGVARCFAECQEGLDCFAWQCREISGKVCVWQQIRIEIAPPDNAITVLEWHPPPGASGGCRRYAAQINADTWAHERRHAADNVDAARTITSRYRNWAVMACAADEVTARREASLKADDLVERARNEVIRFAEQRSAALHAAEGSDRDKAFVVDCRKCGE